MCSELLPNRRFRARRSFSSASLRSASVADRSSLVRSSLVFLSSVSLAVRSFLAFRSSASLATRSSLTLLRSVSLAIRSSLRLRFSSLSALFSLRAASSFLWNSSVFDTFFSICKLYQNRLIQANYGIFPFRHFATDTGIHSAGICPGVIRILGRRHRHRRYHSGMFEASDRLLQQQKNRFRDRQVPRKAVPKFSVLTERLFIRLCIRQSL